MRITEGAPSRRRDETRRLFIAAARDLFFRMDFNRVTVGEIARRAGLTRAAFYLHFTGKDDVLAAMMIDHSQYGEALFRWFRGKPRTRETIGGFIREFMASSRSHRANRLFHIVSLQSDLARQAFLENRARLMTVLARDFPAFARPGRDDPVGQARWARGTLIIVQIEQIAIRDQFGDDAGEVDRLIDDIAAQMLAFDASYPGG